MSEFSTLQNDEKLKNGLNELDLINRREALIARRAAGEEIKVAKDITAKVVDPNAIANMNSQLNSSTLLRVDKLKAQEDELDNMFAGRKENRERLEEINNELGSVDLDEDQEVLLIIEKTALEEESARIGLLVQEYLAEKDLEEKKIRDAAKQATAASTGNAAVNAFLAKMAAINNANNPQGGNGKRNAGLFNYEIETLMNKYKSKGFRGVYAVDQLHHIPLSKKYKILSFIMNTEPITTPNGHWVAVVITPDNLEYYDSFGEDPNRKFLKNMKKLAHTLSPNKLLQFKINRVKFQRANSDNCGYFAMKFIADRHDGKNFKQATGFEIINRAIKGEKDIDKFKKKFKQFNSI